MSEPKKVDRRKFIYAGLGAVALIAIGAAAYVAMNPPVVTQTVTTSTTVPTTSLVTTTVPTTSVVTSTTTSVTTVPGTIVLRWLTRDYNLKYSQQYAADYQKMNPNIKIILEAAPYPGLYEKQFTALAGGMGYDISESYTHRWIRPFAAMGFLLELDDFWQNELTEEDRKDYFPKGIEMCSWKGHLYAIPTRTDGYVTYWNPVLHEKLGLPMRAPKTWDEYLDFAKALTAVDPSTGKKTRYGIGWIGNPAEDACNYAHIINMIWSLGGDILSEDMKPKLLTSEVMDAFKFLCELGPLKHDVVAPGWMNLAWADIQPHFAKEYVAMITAVSVQGYFGIQGVNPGMKVGIGRIPEGPAGAFCQPAGWAFAIAKSTPYPNEAKKLLKWLIEPQRVAYLTTALPGRGKALEVEKYDIFRKDPLLQYGLQGGGEIVKTDTPLYSTPATTELLTILGKTFMECFQGADIRQRLEAAQTEMEKAIRKYT
jgi:multiple sugar transport system substrate-binding protein